MKYVVVAGSFEYHHTWYQDPCSSFNAMMHRYGLHLYEPAFRWSGGILLTDFQAAADALRCHLRAFDDIDRNVVAYSNGGQAPLVLAAQGFYLRTLTTVGTPYRHDVNNDAAEDFIEYHQAIYDEIDPIRWLGEIDGVLGGHSYFPRARRYNLHDIGHGRVLLEPRYIALWEQMGWIDAIKALETPRETLEVSS